ncbi:hypothetical protein [Neglectibacter caecimuris]|nr:hypothetical protein [Neglectibacter sp. M00184]
MLEEGNAMYLAIILAYVILTVGICWLLALRGSRRSRGKEKEKSPVDKL